MRSRGFSKTKKLNDRFFFTYPAGYAINSDKGSQSKAALLPTVNPRTLSNLT